MSTINVLIKDRKDPYTISKRIAEKKRLKQKNSQRTRQMKITSKRYNPTPDYPVERTEIGEITLKKAQSKDVEQMILYRPHGGTSYR